MLRRRLLKDVAELGQDLNDGVIVLDVQDMGNIKILLSAPDDSDYATGMFNVDVTVPSDTYPMEPPLFHFTTKIFHPNISTLDGEVCVDVLKEKWAPSITLRAACEIIQALLRDPNSASPLNVTAARMLRRDPDMFRDTVQMWTKVLARGTKSQPHLEEALGIVTAATAASESKALEALTDHNWDIQGACDSLM